MQREWKKVLSVGSKRAGIMLVFPCSYRADLVLSLGATKDMGKMLGGDEEKDPDAAKKEEERQEALRQQEEERKAKYAKMEAEREVMRQGIRDKVRIWLSAHTWATCNAQCFHLISDQFCEHLDRAR